MALPQEIIDSSSGMGGDILNVAKVGGSIIFAGGIIMKSIVKVPKFHEGIRTVRANPERTWGRKKGQLYGRVGSGFHLVYPFVGSIESVSTREQPHNLAAFSVVLSDGKKYTSDGSITWHVISAREHVKRQEKTLSREEYLKQLYYKLGHAFVKWDMRLNNGLEPTPQKGKDHLYNALYKVQDERLNERIMSLVSPGIALAVSELDDIKDAYRPGVIHSRVVELYGDSLLEYGVALDDVNLREFSPSEHQVSADAIIRAFMPPDHDSGAAQAAMALHVVGD
jgi:hypothetical protein